MQLRAAKSNSCNAHSSHRKQTKKQQTNKQNNQSNNAVEVPRKHDVVKMLNSPLQMYTDSDSAY